MTDLQILSETNIEIFENIDSFKLIEYFDLESSNTNISIEEFSQLSNKIVKKIGDKYWDWFFNLQKQGTITFVIQNEEFEFCKYYIRVKKSQSQHCNIFKFLEGVPALILISKQLGIEESLVDKLLLYIKNNFDHNTICDYLEKNEQQTNFEQFLLITCIGELFGRFKKKVNLSSFKQFMSSGESYIYNYYLLKNENSILTKEKLLITHPSRNEFDLEITLSKKLLDIILPGIDERFNGRSESIKSLNNKNEEKIEYYEGYSIIPNKLISEVPLFLNNQNLKFVDQVKTIINNKGKVGLSNTSLCMMLHGYPGTGKTEFAKQICKEQGLKLMVVEGSEIVNKYIGETEQNIHNLFKEYKRLWEESEIPVVLLFNECDQILSKKVSVEKSTDIFNNAVQSQLLNELEKFKGILISTCNSIENLEEAFKRRFLFNIKFEKPDESVRFKIWNSIPGFWQNNQNLLHELSRYNITGAEIRNITNKYNLICDSDTVKDTKLLFDLVEDESNYLSKQTKIGF